MKSSKTLWNTGMTNSPLRLRHTWNRRPGPQPPPLASGACVGPSCSPAPPRQHPELNETWQAVTPGKSPCGGSTCFFCFDGLPRQIRSRSVRDNFRSEVCAVCGMFVPKWSVAQCKNCLTQACPLCRRIHLSFTSYCGELPTSPPEGLEPCTEGPTPSTTVVIDVSD